MYKSQNFSPSAADLFAHFLDLRDLIRVALGDVVAAEDDDVPLEEHQEVVVAVQEDAELPVQLSEPGQLTGLVPLRQGLQVARNAVQCECEQLSDDSQRFDGGFCRNFPLNKSSSKMFCFSIRCTVYYFVFILNRTDVVNISP